MTTKVYGASDDLLEFDGDVSGEVSCYGTDEQPHGVLLVFSDGTVLEAKYGKAHLGIWSLSVIQRGVCLNTVTECTDEDARPHSDVAEFFTGLKWCIQATEWKKVD